MDFKKIVVSMVSVLVAFFFGAWFTSQGYSLVPRATGDQLAAALLLLAITASFFAKCFAKKKQGVMIVMIVTATMSLSYLAFGVMPKFKINWEASFASLCATLILLGLASASQIKSSKSSFFH